MIFFFRGRNLSQETLLHTRLPAIPIKDWKVMKWDSYIGKTFGAIVKFERPGTNPFRNSVFWKMPPLSTIFLNRAFRNMPPLPRILPPIFWNMSHTFWNKPPLSGICPHFQEYAPTFWNMPSLSGICPHFLEYAPTFWNMPPYTLLSGMCLNMPFRNMPPYFLEYAPLLSGICVNMPFWSMPPTFWNTLKYAVLEYAICPHFLEYVSCHNNTC